MDANITRNRMHSVGCVPPARALTVVPIWGEVTWLGGGGLGGGGDDLVLVVVDLARGEGGNQVTSPRDHVTYPMMHLVSLPP